MIAEVQYWDFTWSVAADISDHYNLFWGNILADFWIDKDKYELVWFDIFSSHVTYNQKIIDTISLSLLCKELVWGDLVKFNIGKSLTATDILRIFKRLNVVMHSRDSNNQDEPVKSIDIY